MTITFHLPGTAAERLAFAYSPVLEAVLSLHVLVEPKHHPLQHPWVRQMRELAPALKAEIAAFAFAYRSYFPAFLFPNPSGTYATFEDELTQLATAPAAAITFEFTETFCAGVLARDPARLADPAAQQFVLAQAGALGPKTQQLVELAFTDPPRLLARFSQLLADYWDAAFRAEWQRLEPLLAANVAAAGQQIAQQGLYPFLAELWPEVGVDARAECFWVERPHEHDVPIGPTKQLVLAPSLYVWPHVRVNCDPPWPLALVFPTAGIRQAAHPLPAPTDLVRLFRALGDELRLQILHLIAEQPRSTQELASLINLSEPALSKHLRLLAKAGLLETHRSGYYVLYHLTAGAYVTITSGLHHYLTNDARPNDYTASDPVA